MHLIDGEIVEISKEAADYAFYKQVLTGDSTDNYKGCPSVGDKKADKVLELGYFGDPWKAIVKEYKKQGLSEKVALENARLARILRHGEYNFETKTITLWKP
jgi:DNA polymerase-1